MDISNIYNDLNDKNIESVINTIKYLNKSYREGNSLITDKEYDNIIDKLKEIDPNNDIFKSGVIENVTSNRKEKLKYPMFSLDKETTLDNIFKWLKNKNLPLSTFLIITPKYDGISILKNEKTGLAWSRGDGFEGETLHEHYKKMNEKNSDKEFFTIGEMIIPKTIFNNNKFYRENGEPFKNARNMVAGLKNSDIISDDLKIVNHIRYGIADDDFNMNKSEQLDFISNEFNPIPYIKIEANNLNVDILNDLFFKWGKDFDIDGLVIDIDDKNIRKSLGREKNNNPSYAIAYKNPEWSEQVETELIDIEWNISKQGYLKPIGILNPVELEGVTISRVTLNNAKFVKDNNLGKGSKIIIIRSGMVIPKVIKVIKSTGFELPNYENIYWNENNVELCINDTEEQKIKKIISFFEILGADNISEGIVKQIYNYGYKDLKQILNLKIEDLEKIDKFGKRKSEIVFNSIQKSIKNVELSKLQHASGIFKNLGSKKLALLSHFKEKPDINEIIKIDGFSEILAKNFIDGFDEFNIWIKNLPITINKEKQIISESNDMDGMVFVFTGVRLKDEENILKTKGAKIGSTVSKNTTHLICKDPNSNSSKMNKARELGIKIMSVEEFKNLLK
jgi:NAD-dependent DNA ligase